MHERVDKKKKKDVLEKTLSAFFFYTCFVRRMRVDFGGLFHYIFFFAILLRLVKKIIISCARTPRASSIYRARLCTCAPLVNSSFLVCSLDTPGDTTRPQVRLVAGPCCDCLSIQARVGKFRYLLSFPLSLLLFVCFLRSPSLSLSSFLLSLITITCYYYPYYHCHLYSSITNTYHFHYHLSLSLLTIIITTIIINTILSLIT